MEGDMKTLRMARAFLLSGLFFQISQGSVFSADASGRNLSSLKEGSQAKQKEIVAAYFAGWDIYGKKAYAVESIYPIAHKLTHIIYAFAKPNPDKGVCELQDPWGDVGANLEHYKKLSGNFAKLLELKSKYPHLKILLSIGGGTNSKQISEIVKKGYAKKFVASCVDLLDRYEYRFVHSQTGQEQFVKFSYEKLFDGIDFDWEWLNNVVPEEEAKAFVEMMVLFRKLLDKRALRRGSKQLLTVALQVNASVYKALYLHEVVSVVDWFNLMAYNFTGVTSRGVGFNAPIHNPWSVYSINNAVEGVLNAGVSADKIVLGIPLYGHLFDQTNGKLGASFDRTDISGPVSYSKIKEKYLANDACQYSWHPGAKVPYLYCAQDKIFISFDNELSIKEKVAYARQKHLKGVMFWRLAHDDENHSLVNAVS